MSDAFKGKVSALLEQAEQEQQRRHELQLEHANTQAARIEEEKRVLEEVWRPVLTEAVELLKSRGWTAKLSDAPYRNERDQTPGLRLEVGKHSITYRPGSRDLKGSHGNSGTGMRLLGREEFEADVLTALKDLVGE